MPGATPNYGLIRPDFNISGWHDDVNGNFDLIDSVLFAVTGLGGLVGEWSNATNYLVGQRVIDPDDGGIWSCLVAHTSSPSGTMETDRNAHPTYWATVSTLPFNRGQWANDTVYTAGDMAYDPDEFILGICADNHTSNHSGSMRDDVAHWDLIADFADVAISVTSVNSQTGAVVLDPDDLDDSSTTNKFATAAELAAITDHEDRISDLETTIAALGGAANKDVSEIIPSGVMWPWTATTAPSLTNDNGSTPAWLVCKGGTIGDGSSGASLRANADMQTLFTHLWTNFAQTELPIQTSAGGASTRGASAAADFAAHKRMPVPNVQGNTIYFADNSRGKITVTGHSTSGAQIGAQNLTLTTSHIPANIPASFNGTALGTHNHTYKRGEGSFGAQADGHDVFDHDDDANTSSKSAGTPSGSVTVNASGGGTPTPTLAPGFVLPTAIIKT